MMVFAFPKDGARTPLAISGAAGSVVALQAASRLNRIDTPITRFHLITTEPVRSVHARIRADVFFGDIPII